jgi:hypothetical protein
MASKEGISVRDFIPCEECGRYDVARVHWCGSENGLTKSYGRPPACCYCWGPVAPRLGKRGQLLGWPDFCSDACRKLGGRKLGAAPSAATRELIAEVAAR